MTALLLLQSLNNGIILDERVTFPSFGSYIVAISLLIKLELSLENFREQPIQTVLIVASTTQTCHVS